MNTHPDILVLGYSEAAMFLRGTGAQRVAAIISIHGAQEWGAELDIPHRLDLQFDDVEAPDGSDPVAVYRAGQQRRWEAENGLHRRPPTLEDARAIIRFAESIRHVDGRLLCHCNGGVSRSPAAAILCLAVWTKPGNERSLVEYVRQIRPCAMPHADLIRWGDDLLRRHGALLAALH